MDKTLQNSIQPILSGLTSSVEAQSVEKPAEPLHGINREPTNPSGRTCCGLSLTKSRNLSLSSNRPVWTEVSSSDGSQTWNGVVTGSQGELLTASTGCPSNAPDGISSEQWALLGWSFGIVYTLTASEWKGRTYRGARSCDSMGTVPTVCEAEYLQGFRRGELHSWAREMQSRNQ